MKLKNLERKVSTQKNPTVKELKATNSLPGE